MNWLCGPQFSSENCHPQTAEIGRKNRSIHPNTWINKLTTIGVKCENGSKYTCIISIQSCKKETWIRGGLRRGGGGGGRWEGDFSVHIHINTWFNDSSTS